MTDIRGYRGHLLVVQLFPPAGHRPRSLFAIQDNRDHRVGISGDKRGVIKNGLAIEDPAAIKPVAGQAIILKNFLPLLKDGSTVLPHPSKARATMAKHTETRAVIREGRNLLMVPYLGYRENPRSISKPGFQVLGVNC